MSYTGWSGEDDRIRVSFAVLHIFFLGNNWINLCQKQTDGCSCPIVYFLCNSVPVLKSRHNMKRDGSSSTQSVNSLYLPEKWQTNLPRQASWDALPPTHTGKKYEDMNKWIRDPLSSLILTASSLLLLCFGCFCSTFVLTLGWKAFRPGTHLAFLTLSKERKTRRSKHGSVGSGELAVWDFVENKKHQRTRASHHHLQAICQPKFNHFSKAQVPGAPGVPCWWAKSPPNHIFCGHCMREAAHVVCLCSPRSDPWFVRGCLNIFWGACHFQWLWWMECLSLSWRSQSGNLCRRFDFKLVVLDGLVLKQHCWETATIQNFQSKDVQYTSGHLRLKHSTDLSHFKQNPGNTFPYEIWYLPYGCFCPGPSQTTAWGSDSHIGSSLFNDLVSCPLSLGILFGFGSFFPRLADIQKATTGRDFNNNQKKTWYCK